jgi:hypothetical protein
VSGQFYASTSFPWENSPHAKWIEKLAFAVTDIVELLVIVSGFLKCQSYRDNKIEDGL